MHGLGGQPGSPTKLPRRAPAVPYRRGIGIPDIVFEVGMGRHEEAVDALT
jgi:hypothetical protein